MDYWLELIGSVCFALCGLPAAVRAWRLKYADFDWAFLLLWFVGELCLTIWAWRQGFWVLVGLNYIPNIFFLMIIIRYNFLRPRP